MQRVLSMAFLTVALLPPGANSKDPPRLQLSKEEQTILDLTNKERAQEKLPPLAVNLLLFQAARGHSANMLKQDKMEHVLDGKTPAQRVEATGYDYKRVAENIAWSDGDTLENIMKNWMNSPAHRMNILRSDMAEIGIGLARNEKGETYYTQVFGMQRQK